MLKKLSGTQFFSKDNECHFLKKINVVFSGGSSRNQPIGTAFSSNIGSNTSKMGFFGKKDEQETNHSDLFYNKSFPAGRNNLTDNLVNVNFFLLILFYAMMIW